MVATPSSAPLDLGGLEIALAIGLLLGGTVVLVSGLTVLARVVGWLLGEGRSERASDGTFERHSAGASRRHRRVGAGLPRTALVGLLAAALLFALAWSSYVLSRVREIG